MHTQGRPVVLHAWLFIQTQEADALIRPNCGLTPSRKPLTVKALDLELPHGILTKLAIGTYVVLDRYSHDILKLQ